MISRREGVGLQCRGRAARQNSYGDLILSLRLERFAWVVRLDWEHNLYVTARMLLMGDFTFCPIHDFNGLRAACTTAGRFGSRLPLTDSRKRSGSIALRGLGLARQSSFNLLVKIIAALSWVVTSTHHIACPSFLPEAAGCDVCNRA